jgi:hypothetical protein
MTLGLQREWGYRDPMNTLTRKECEYLAQYKGVKINPDWPKTMILKTLKANGVQGIQSPLYRGLGATIYRVPSYAEWVNLLEGKTAIPAHHPQSNSEVLEVDADTLAEAQWAAAEKQETYGEWTIQSLRKECKARDIKVARTDNKATLVAKLNGQNPTQ